MLCYAIVNKEPLNEIISYSASASQPAIAAP